MLRRTPVAGPAGFASAIDQPVIVLTITGPQYVGILSFYDGFGNVVLRDSAQRVASGASYADVPLGWLLVRGDDVSAMIVNPVPNPKLLKESSPENVFAKAIAASA